MNKQVEAIRDEIQRRIKEFESKYPVDLGGYWNDEQCAADNCAEEYKRFLQFIDSLPEESASEDLEQELIKYRQSHGYFEYTDMLDFARHFAEWQHGKDFDDLLQSEMKFPKEYYEKGRFDMRNEMMKDAVECVFGSYLTTGLEKYFPNFKIGDKVKIIVTKENN